MRFIDDIIALTMAASFRNGQRNAHWIESGVPRRSARLKACRISRSVRMSSSRYRLGAKPSHGTVLFTGVLCTRLTVAEISNRPLKRLPTAM